jgi:tripeptidyl-peptidase-1
MSGSAHPKANHAVKFEVKLRNLERLKQLVEDVSNPVHEDYGKHLTKEQLGEIITNHQAIETIERYLNREGAIVKGKTPNGEFIEAEAPIGSWERIFSTTFFEYHHKKTPSFSVFRAHQFTLPLELHAHVEYVFEVVDLPPVITGGPIVYTPIDGNERRKLLRKSKTTTIHSEAAAGYVTPALLNSQYSITSNTGNSLTTQAAMECINQWLDTRDLTVFQNHFNLPNQPITATIGGNVGSGACAAHGLGNCTESNLDFQYLMAVAQKIPTIALYDQHCNYLSFFASLTNPPKVISISYGAMESGWGNYLSNAFNNVAMQLAAMGVTIVVASGDDGAAGANARGHPEQCGYAPMFPAASAYVLSVGATQVRKLFSLFLLNLNLSFNFHLFFSLFCCHLFPRDQNSVILKSLVPPIPEEISPPVVDSLYLMPNPIGRLRSSRNISRKCPPPIFPRVSVIDEDIRIFPLWDINISSH